MPFEIVPKHALNSVLQVTDDLAKLIPSDVGVIDGVIEIVRVMLIVGVIDIVGVMLIVGVREAGIDGEADNVG